MVVFSNKAYNAIIRESFDKDPVETGGILLGHVLDNGIWIVMEVLPPGIHCIFERAYFEYDDAFVNYLAQSVANQYKIPLELLGLWHRHPGSMDFFSSTDDQTNSTFAAQNDYGVISGLVNIDPQFRLTMYHLNQGRQFISGVRPAYEKVAIEVGDDIIPEEYFELRYYDGEESNLHPHVERNTRQARETRISSSDRVEHHEGTTGSIDIQKILDENMRKGSGGDSDGSTLESSKKTLEERVAEAIRFFRRNRFILILLLVFLFGLSLKASWEHIKKVPKVISEWVHKDNNNPEQATVPTHSLEVGQTVDLSEYLPTNWDKKGVTYSSDSKSVQINMNKGKAVSSGDATITAKTKKGDKAIIVKIIVATQQYQLNHERITLLVGDSCQLELTPNLVRVQWESDNTAIATISQRGLIVAISPGETTIHAYADGDEVACCSIKINDSADNTQSSDSFTPYTLVVDNGPFSESGSLNVGASHTLKYKTNLPEQELSKIVWESSDTSVASIDSQGKIRTYKAGTAVITVKYNELSSSWQLTVKEK